MNISWHGGSTVELKQGKHSALLNPEKKADLKGMNVAIYDHSDDKQAVPDEGLLVNWPGEYDASGFSFRGIEVHGEKGATLIYTFHTPAGNVAWMAEMSEYPSKEFIEELGEVHVLLVPVGGKDVLDAKLSFRLVEALEPMVVIPICYGDKRGDLSAFLKEMDVKKPDVQKSFDFKRSALSMDQMELVLLQS